MNRSALLTCCLLLTSLLARAGESSVTISDLSVGEPLQGEAYNREKVRNRVAVVEFWGYNCPPCRRSLPHLAKWDKEMRDKGLVMIGVHCQNATKAQVLGLLKKSGVEFPVYNFGQVKGVTFRSIPRLFVFDHNGKMIYNGSPFRAEQTIRKAVEAIPPSLPGPGKFVKLAYVARRLSSMRDLGSAVTLLEKKAKDKDEAIAKEAKTLLERTRKYGEHRLSEAAKLKGTDPGGCNRLYREVVVQFRGCDIGGKAKKAVDELRNDKDFQREIKAAADMAKVLPLEKYLKPVGGNSDPKSSAFRKHNAAVIRNILKACQYVLKNHKGTAAAREAQEMYDRYK